MIFSKKTTIRINIIVFLFTIPLSIFSQQVMPDSTLKVFKNGLQLIRKNGYFGLVNPKDTTIHPCEWSNIKESTAYPNMYLIDSSYNYGLMDKESGRILLRPEWAYIDTFKNSIALVYKRTTLTDNRGYFESSYFLKGLIDKKGDLILPPLYFIKKMSDGSFAAKQVDNNKIVILDAKGKFQKELNNHNIFVYPRKYQNQTYDSLLAIFNDKSFIAIENDSFAIVDNKGKKTTINYEMSNNFHSYNDSFPYFGLKKRLKKDEPYRSYEPNRFMLIHAQTGKTYFFDDGGNAMKGNMKTFRKDGLEGILSDTGIVVPNEYFRLDKLAENSYYGINKDTNLVFMDNTFKPYWVSSFKIIGIYPIERGKNKIRLLSNKYGVIDDFGRVIIDFKYDEMSTSFDSYIMAKKQGEGYSIFDTDGRVIINPDKYIVINTISNKKLNKIYNETNKPRQFFEVSQDYSKFGLFDIKGKQLTNLEYDKIQVYLYSTFLVKKDDKWGIVNFEGKKIIEPKWANVDFVRCGNQEIAYIKKDGKRYAILNDGTEELLGSDPCFSKAAIQTEYIPAGSSGSHKN